MPDVRVLQLASAGAFPDFRGWDHPWSGNEGGILTGVRSELLPSVPMHGLGAQASRPKGWVVQSLSYGMQDGVAIVHVGDMSVSMLRRSFR
jgi:hypothetical protein